MTVTRCICHGYAKELLLRNKAGIGEISFDFNDEFVLFQVVLLKEDEEVNLSIPVW